MTVSDRLARILAFVVALIVGGCLGFFVGTARERVRSEILERERLELQSVASRMSEVSAHCVADLAATVAVWTRPLPAARLSSGKGQGARPAR